MESDWRFNNAKFGNHDWWEYVPGLWLRPIYTAELVTPLHIGGLDIYWVCRYEQRGLAPGVYDYLMFSVFADYVAGFAFGISGTGSFPRGYVVKPD